MQVAAVVTAIFLSASTVWASGWKEYKADHFIVFHTGDEAYAKEVGRNADKYYVRIADELGYQRYSNFWQWDNRAKIYIYPNADTFRKATGEKEWSHGMASYTKKEIHFFYGETNIMETILPHEIAHLVFRDFVGIDGFIPLWLDEGVAQWQEPPKRAIAFDVARYLIRTNTDFVIQDLMALDIRQVTDEKKVQAYYMQSVTLVDYLVKVFGSQRFTEFCRNLRDGKKIDDALRNAYPGVIENLHDLDQRWRNYVSARQPAEPDVYS